MDARIAVVTGANRGIGREVCRQLARRGLEVILTARNTAGGQAAAAELHAEGLAVRFMPLDVSDHYSVRRFMKSVADEIGRTDVLVNNAAIYIDAGISLRAVDLGFVRQAIETNFFGALRLCQMVVPLMQRHGYGRIVNVSTQMASLSQMGGGAIGYRASKVALHALTRVLAAEVRGANILVNAVDPGWVQTDMGGRHAPRSVEQGAAGIVWAATLPDGGPGGGYFRDGQPLPW